MYVLPHHGVVHKGVNITLVPYKRRPLLNCGTPKFSEWGGTDISYFSVQHNILAYRLLLK
jgi:hypothetical protein